MEPILLSSNETALEVANEALQLFVGYGYTKLFPIEKLLRDVRLLRIYEGTSEVQRIILANHLLTEYQPALPPQEDLPLHREHDPNDAQSAQSTDKVGHAGFADMCITATQHRLNVPIVFFRTRLLRKSDRETGKTSV